MSEHARNVLPRCRKVWVRLFPMDTLLMCCFSLTLAEKPFTMHIKIPSVFSLYCLSIAPRIPTSNSQGKSGGKNNCIYLRQKTCHGKPAGQLIPHISNLALVPLVFETSFHPSQPQDSFSSLPRFCPPAVWGTHPNLVPPVDLLSPPHHPGH